MATVRTDFTCPRTAIWPVPTRAWTGYDDEPPYGVTTVRQYLTAGLLDELVLHLVPITLGAGERLLDDVGPHTFEQVEVDVKPAVTHVTYRVQG